MALVLAVCSFVVFPFLPALVALVLARGARREIAASGGRLPGGAWSRAAAVVAWVNIALSLSCWFALAGLVAVAAGAAPAAGRASSRGPTAARAYAVGEPRALPGGVQARRVGQQPDPRRPEPALLRPDRCLPLPGRRAVGAQPRKATQAGRTRSPARPPRAPGAARRRQLVARAVPPVGHPDAPAASARRRPRARAGPAAASRRAAAGPAGAAAWRSAARPRRTTATG